jgi:uncharacterized protein (TIGR02284 family)
MPEHIALDKVESSLKDLIETLRGSQEGYQEFGARLHDPRAKRLFLEETQRRAEYAAELENELHRMGVHDVKEGVSPTAKLRHLWGEIQAHLSGDQALLSAAEKSDDVARKAYASTLKQELPLPLREMLDRQLAHIERSQVEMRTLQDLK